MNQLKRRYKIFVNWSGCFLSIEKLIEPTLKGVLATYKKELDLYQRFFDISKKQSNLNEINDVDEIKGYLEEKRKILADVDTLEKNLLKAKAKILNVLGIEEFTVSNLKDKVEAETLESIRLKLKEIGFLILSIEKLENKSQINLNKIINNSKK